MKEVYVNYEEFPNMDEGGSSSGWFNIDDFELENLKKYMKICINKEHYKIIETENVLEIFTDNETIEQMLWSILDYIEFQRRENIKKMTNILDNDFQKLEKSMEDDVWILKVIKGALEKWN